MVASGSQTMIADSSSSCIASFHRSKAKSTAIADNSLRAAGYAMPGFEAAVAGHRQETQHHRLGIGIPEIDLPEACHAQWGGFVSHSAPEID